MTLGKKAPNAHGLILPVGQNRQAHKHVITGLDPTRFTHLFGVSSRAAWL